MRKGLNKKVVLHISEQKNEPGWMTDFRLKALEIFEQKPMPSWGPNIGDVSFADLQYYVAPITSVQKNWDDVPLAVRDTFEKLGVPQAERAMLAGLSAQFESDIIYKKLQERWQKQGIIFLDTETALLSYPELFKKYFATVVPAHDNKFAALNSAVWSGGNFVYIPAGVQLDQPLQAYFRMQSKSMGQFERTLIIAEPGSFIHYVEGCSAPVHKAHSLHSAVVEIVALKKAHVRYTTIQNWSNNVYNLVTKRAHAYDHAVVEWIDGNFGSKVTMKYPSIVLKGKHSRGQIISLARSGAGQQHDAGGKIVHEADYTSSNIVAKSICTRGGYACYRGLVKVAPHLVGVTAQVQCATLLLDDQTRSDTYPILDVQSDDAIVGHEASVSKISKQQLFYGMSKGLSQQQTQAMIVHGFIDCFVKQLPMEYAIEINRLMQHDMEGSI